MPKHKYLTVIHPPPPPPPPQLFPCTHSIWTWPAPTMQWQVTIASLHLINCRNNILPHKTGIFFQAEETLRTGIVGAKGASKFSLCLSLKTGCEWVGLLVGTELGGWGGMWGGGGGGMCLACEFTSRLRYPSGLLGRQNTFCEGSFSERFYLFVLPSVAAFLTFSHLSSVFIRVFLFLPVCSVSFSHSFKASLITVVHPVLVLVFPHSLSLSNNESARLKGWRVRNVCKMDV